MEGQRSLSVQVYSLSDSVSSSVSVYSVSSSSSSSYSYSSSISFFLFFFLLSLSSFFCCFAFTFPPFLASMMIGFSDWASTIGALSGSLGRSSSIWPLGSISLHLERKKSDSNPRTEQIFISNYTLRNRQQQTISLNNHKKHQKISYRSPNPTFPLQSTSFPLNQKIQQHYPSSLVTGALPIFRLACCLIFFRLSPLLYSNTSVFLKLNFILFELFMSIFASHSSSSGVQGFFQSQGSFFRHPFMDVQLFELGKTFSLLRFKSMPYQALQILQTDTLVRLLFPFGLKFSLPSLLSPASSSRSSISPCETMRTWTFLVSISSCTFLLERKMLRLIMAWKKYNNWQNIIQKNFCGGNQ